MAAKLREFKSKPNFRYDEKGYSISKSHSSVHLMRSEGKHSTPDPVKYPMSLNSVEKLKEIKESEYIAHMDSSTSPSHFTKNVPKQLKSKKSVYDKKVEFASEIAKEKESRSSKFSLYKKANKKNELLLKNKIGKLEGLDSFYPGSKTPRVQQSNAQFYSYSSKILNKDPYFVNSLSTYKNDVKSSQIFGRGKLFHKISSRGYNIAKEHKPVKISVKHQYPAERRRVNDHRSICWNRKSSNKEYKCDKFCI